MDIISKTYNIYLNKLCARLIPKNLKRNHIIFRNSLAYSKDIQKVVRSTYQKSKRDTRVVVIFLNFLWKPAIDTYLLFKKVKTSNKYIEPNWLSKDDISNIFNLENFEKIREGNYLSLFAYQIYRPITKPNKSPSVSVIIPARNESGNIQGILKKIPQVSQKMEIIFVEGNSRDDTYLKIQDEVKNNNSKNIKCYLYKQKGIGKNDAVKLGFSKAKNDILMILDADLTVKPSELSKFYKVIAENKADFVMGSRLIYPMEAQAMRYLNYLGNKFFSLLFSYIIGQKIKDTLCGTKVLLRKNYLLIKANQKYFGNFDPFGDFDLIFGSSKLNFKIAEIPVRYGQRKYGQTNISRFSHGLLLLKMAMIGLIKFKF